LPRTVPREIVLRFENTEHIIEKMGDNDSFIYICFSVGGAEFVCDLHPDMIEIIELDKLPSIEEYITNNPNTKPNTAFDTQVGGNHYTKLAIQPMEYSMKNNLSALQHTIIKYITRYKDKNGLDDLLKAKHCIDMLIELDYKGK
jgi:hypothetical protein